MDRVLLTAQEIKRIYGLHRNTLLNWEKQRLLEPAKTPGGRRRYRREDIEHLLGMLEKQQDLSPEVILYARASTRKQEEYLMRRGCMDLVEGRGSDYAAMPAEFR